MGNRVSISFKKGEQESVALFSHWGGEEFVERAQGYVDKLHKRIGGPNPLDRLEPNTVMVDFIRYLTKSLDRVYSDLYLGKDKNDGDNSDNGHFVIDLVERKKFKYIISYKGKEIEDGEIESFSSDEAKEVLMSEIIDNLEVDVV